MTQLDLRAPEVSLPPTACPRLGVLVSGRGSNLQALLDATARGGLAARVVAVASNKAEAAALDRAARAGVPHRAFPRDEYPTRRARDEAMADYLREQGVDLVVLAGYDRVLATSVIAAFRGRMINVHPSLLPAFGGTLHAPAEALRHGVKISGCTVHFVTEDLDSGPIILQRAVPVLEDDTEETLAARILREEHQALPEAIRLLAAGRVRLAGRRAVVLPP
ncbi:MAG TPA: phosphoribosylglycinamide formyltransferase [Chloroflexota bacterium]|nr:phosphoribosylglycinamide formyltransferase [Chloroflexota bacterium]